MEGKIKLYTEEEVKKIAAIFATTYNSGACQWDKHEDALRDINNNSTPIEIIGGSEFMQSDDVYIEDCNFEDGRYESVLVPIEFFKGFRF